MSTATYRETLATFLESPVQVPAAETTSELIEQMGVVINVLAMRVVALEKTEAAREKREREREGVRVDSEYDIQKRLTALEARGSLKYCGVWDAEKAYTVGDFVTHKGSMWHCWDGNVGVRPGTSTAWQQSVQKGRDARDNR